MLRIRATSPSIAGNQLDGDPDGRCEADVLIVGGDATPGLVVISKAGIPYEWDKRKGYGYGGAWLIFKGDDLSEFDTTFTVWREDQRTLWAQWQKKYLTVSKLAKPQQSGPTPAARAQAQQIGAAAQAQAAQQTDPAAKNLILQNAQSRITDLLNAGTVTGYIPNLPTPKALGVSNPILNELGIKAIVPKFVGQWVAGTGTARGKWTKTVSWYQFKPPVPLLGRPDSSIKDTHPKVVAQDPVQLQIRSKLDDIQARQKRIAQIRGKT